ncbi:pseudouridine synthase [Dipodascopsis uninucleata]
MTIKIINNFNILWHKRRISRRRLLTFDIFYREKVTLAKYLTSLQFLEHFNGDNKDMIKEDYKFWTKKDLISRIHELERAVGSSIEESNLKVEITKKKEKIFRFNDHPTRFIALRFAYLGWNYNGLNVQSTETPLPTVEGMILKALTTCKLIADENDLEACQFSRCGRTDKGVSALGQVISLRVRSKLLPEMQQDPANDDLELSYITMLNNLLPPDIRMYQVCLHPPEGFDARFSCKSRHYKYFFISEKESPLDIDAMKRAATMLIGTHDFRNYCRIDGSKQITNFVRHILHAEITPVRDVATGDEMYVFDLRGTAFLWHQVRCIMGILLLIGQNLERPEIMAELLNVDLYPRKPIYEMASDLPLVLYNCEFDPSIPWKLIGDFSWSANGTNLSTTRGDAYGMWYNGQIKNEMQKALKDVIYSNVIEREQSDRRTKRVRIRTGDGIGRWLGEYIPLEKRQLMDSFEVLNARWLARKTRVSSNYDQE